MNSGKVRALVLGAFGLTLGALMMCGLSGCNSDSSAPAAKAPPPNATAVPGGGSVEDYKKGMERAKQGGPSGGPGGGPAGGPAGGPGR